MKSRLDDAREMVQLGHYDKAVESYQALLAEDPDNTSILFGLLAVFDKMQRYSDIVTTYELLAEAWHRRKFYDHAVICYVYSYTTLVEHAPDSKNRFHHLATQLAKVFREIQTNHWRWTRDALATRGGMRGKTEPTLVELLQRVVTVDPDNPLAHECLLDALVRVGDKSAAKKELTILDRLFTQKSSFF